MSLLRSAAAGFGLGVVWGAAARVWMRLISTDPGFSWSGTGFILALTGTSGLVLGILYGVRRAGRSRWWRVLAVLCLVTFAGPGLVLLPAFALGGLLYLHHPWARVTGLAGIGLGELGLWLLDGGQPINPWYHYGGFLVLSLTLAAGAAELYRPRTIRSIPKQPQFAVS
ncbi:hypothetical protein [Kribbella speibonae]|uniref:Uncharacterized protein n=1 Tax=Kribbella speibonae TaxID=1572660 RepID=A0A4R0IRP5_9ACTN|nr:hypothetical protein [Kribbella speibonae]TCC35789.1 hypothetical protein E0H92_24090 [Kribbella speibonae]